MTRANKQEVSPLKYYYYQREISLSLRADRKANSTWLAIEELVSQITSAIIRERRNILLQRIPIIKLLLPKLDLVPFSNVEILNLLLYFNQILCATASIVYYPQKAEVLPDHTIDLLTTYKKKWQKHEQNTNEITTTNLATLNQIRIAARKVSCAYQEWMNHTIFPPHMMGKIEKQKQLYELISSIMFFATHYERYLLAGEETGFQLK